MEARHPEVRLRTVSVNADSNGARGDRWMQKLRAQLTRLGE
jgi:hypothetical protein